MKVINWLTLGVALAALVLGIMAYTGVHQLGDRLEETTRNVCIDADEAMESIANSFKMNHLDFDLEWTTPEGYRVRVGTFR